MLINTDIKKLYLGNVPIHSINIGDYNIWNDEEIIDSLIGGYIIDQSGAEDNPALMISYPTAVSKNVFDEIKRRSHIYALDITATDTIPQFIQMDDTNKLITVSGTMIDPATHDLFMRLPSFYWKCVELETDVYQLTFNLKTPEDVENWHHWDGSTFIGVYKAYVDNNKVYSRSGVIPTRSTSQADFKTYARARGNGFQIVTYEAHQIMALLGYGYLGTLNSQAVCGSGTSTIVSAGGTTAYYSKKTGLCDALGMIDTVNSNSASNPLSGNSISGLTNDEIIAGYGTHVRSVNFWGLENWWGDIYEWIDNLRTTDADGTLAICDADNNIVRYAGTAVEVINTSDNKDGASISKIRLGAEGDVVPKELLYPANYNKYYSDYGRVVSASARIAYRSYCATSADGGLAFLYVYNGSGNAHAIIGSRLLYKGSYTII